MFGLFRRPFNLAVLMDVVSVMKNAGVEPSREVFIGMAIMADRLGHPLTASREANEEIRSKTEFALQRRGVIPQIQRETAERVQALEQEIQHARAEGKADVSRAEGVARAAEARAKELQGLLVLLPGGRSAEISEETEETEEGRGE